MANSVPFPADFSQAVLIDITMAHITSYQGLPANQAFVETGSGDPHVFATLVDVSQINTVRFLMAKAHTDTSGDSGVLITLIHNGNPPPIFTCTVMLLQKNALRYQNPRKPG
jgi:hypothetical protein